LFLLTLTSYKVPEMNGLNGFSPRQNRPSSKDSGAGIKDSSATIVSSGVTAVLNGATTVFSGAATILCRGTIVFGGATIFPNGGTRQLREAMAAVRLAVSESRRFKKRESRAVEMHRLA
jgi:hypothetical protein